jgi:hypothetical protein
VARTIRNPDFWLPKDIDFLCDIDSEAARSEIKTAITHFKLTYESPFISCWSFRDYGWMVEILGIHHGPAYRIIRRRATEHQIDGIRFWIAQPTDAPKEKRS